MARLRAHSQATAVKDRGGDPYDLLDALVGLEVVVQEHVREEHLDRQVHEQRRPEVDEGREAVEVGYSIVPDYRGQGFAFEATRTLIAPRRLPAAIYAACLENNVPSLKVLERLGMRFVGATGETLRFELSKDTA